MRAGKSLAALEDSLREASRHSREERFLARWENQVTGAQARCQVRVRC